MTTLTKADFDGHAETVVEAHNFSKQVEQDEYTVDFCAVSFDRYGQPRSCYMPKDKERAIAALEFLLDNAKQRKMLDDYNETIKSLSAQNAP